ncbi:MAG: putative DNA-binding protein [Gammaproteobacteria bacterium]|jgi:putative transcriptional regulator|nr:putative DNA-binding protein [Gammaproteobacteria bacterium]
MKESIVEAVHQSAQDLYEIGMLDAKTMREFDELCLTPIQVLKPKEIKQIRLREKVSQAVLAKYLNTSPSTIKKWETGEKHPRGLSLKVLNLIKVKGLAMFA